MYNVSGFGSKATIVALQTFPMGFTVSTFADDVDPINIEDDEVGGYELLYDGSLFAFTKGNATVVRIAVVAGSEDDTNLKILLGARRMANKLLPISDVTSMVISYPNGGHVVYSNGTILTGPSGDSITLNGRKKGNVYKFAFGTTAGLQSGTQTVSTIAQGVLGLL